MQDVVNHVTLVEFPHLPVMCLMNDELVKVSVKSPANREEAVPLVPVPARTRDFRLDNRLEICLERLNLLGCLSRDLSSPASWLLQPGA